MKNIRQNMGFTQEELAIILGVSRALISLYDKGLRSLPAKTLEKLSRIQLLFNEVEKKEQHLAGSYWPCNKSTANALRTCCINTLKRQRLRLFASAWK
ncbi:helix-turn-helix transcriptional regulator [Niabella yanshanensis]|uniref:Helix-turn-helix transcriptional regulator n=1 Tax=Niabella yanshanensis TaxID=577386 RepID=A0ABZ0W7N6_9BACT|nr:helix-turn-helix transcriptional regulator [Niabella yanshanensis]WQD39201.1 helix-turn-helix transcriptional regulator [Niabella yanshanensis]